MIFARVSHTLWPALCTQTHTTMRVGPFQIFARSKVAGVSARATTFHRPKHQVSSLQTSDERTVLRISASMDTHSAFLHIDDTACCITSGQTHS